MLFQVETLENLAIFELIRCKYKQSSLPALISKAAFTNRKYNGYSGTDYESKFLKARDKICENWIIPGIITYLKNRIILCFRAFVLEIFYYGHQLIELLKRYDFRVKFCIERIYVTQSGRINKAQTVLSILKDSQFLIEFHNGTLFHSMIMKKDLVSVSKEVLDTIKDSTDFYKVLKVKSAIADMLTLYFMDMIYVAKECVWDGLTSNVRAAVGSCLRTKDYEGLRQLCDFMDLDSRQNVLVTNKYNFTSKLCSVDGEMIQYLFLYLPKEEWKEWLKYSFNYYFKVLIHDWRCSGFAVTVFKDALDAGVIDINNIIYIFSLGHLINLDEDDELIDEFAEEKDTYCWSDRYSAHEKISILKMVWRYTPITLRNDVKRYILKSEDITEINAESLLSIVDSYPVGDQGQIISRVMEDIYSRGFAEYKIPGYKILYNMYLILTSKSHGKIIVSKTILQKFLSLCNG